MDHFRITDEYRANLLESAAWSKVGVVLSEAKVVEEAVEEAVEEESVDEAKKKKKKKKGRKDWGGKKGDESKSKLDFKESTEEDEDSETLEEEATHVCPLCMSHLEEAIDEDSLVEHLDVVLGLIDRLSSLNEEEEDMDEAIDAALKDLLVGETEEE